MATETDKDEEQEKPALDRENPPEGYPKTPAGGEQEPEKHKKGHE
jgi:hypothetical protein